MGNEKSPDKEEAGNQANAQGGAKGNGNPNLNKGARNN